MSFEDVKKFNKIIVTGPQRSGTTICAQMLAHDLKVRYVDESDIGIYTESAIRALCTSDPGFVLQCPRAAFACHTFIYPDVAVVFMYRGSYDIKKSQDRINWTNSYQHDELSLYGVTNRTISTVKYHTWRTKQKQLIPNAFEIWYDTLQTHKFWVKPEDRLNSRGRETFVKEINSWVL